MIAAAYVRAGLSFGACATLALVVAPAAADASSWMYTGGGLSVMQRDAGDQQRFVLDIDAGMGTSPMYPIVLGGLFKFPIHYGGGMDVGLAQRTATRGFVLGDWGAALDLGVYQRWWGHESSGFTGNLLLGAPLGIVLNGGATMGTHEARTYSVTLGIDFARLTAHRTTSLSWLPNPMRSDPSGEIR